MRTSSTAGADAPAAARDLFPFHPGTSNLLRALLDRAQESLTDDDLLHLGSLEEDAGTMVRKISVLAEGLACLISYEEAQDDPGSGALQDARSVSDVLFLIGGIADHADGLFRVSSMARAIRVERTTRAKQGARS